MAFNPGQARDEHGRWIAGGGFAKDRKTAELEVEALHRMVFGGGLSKEEKGAVDAYTYGNFEAMNRGLRQGRTSDKVHELDKVFDRTSLPHDIVVHRGAGPELVKKIYDQYQSGKRDIEFEDKGFVSTSAHKAVAESFSRFDRMEIRIPKGSKAIPVLGGGEHEVILPRSSKFKVVSAKKTAGSKRILTVELVSHH